LADPGENAPFAECDAAMSHRLETALESRAPVRRPETDADTQQALEQLGYIDP
jgi:hypothetical protein